MFKENTPQEGSSVDKVVDKIMDTVDALDKAENDLVEALISKIAAGKTALYNAAPSLSRILSKLKIKIVKSTDYRVQTMAVDNFGNIYINPGFSKELSPEEFYGVFAHEALHIANGTHLRAQNKIFEIWNIATDAVMNFALSRDGFKLPANGILPSISTGEFKMNILGRYPVKFKVVDDKGQSVSSENVYEQIISQLPPDAIKECKECKDGPPGDTPPGDKPGDTPPGDKPGDGPPGGGGGGTETVKGKTSIIPKDIKMTDKHLTDEEAREINPDVEVTLTPEMLKELEDGRIDDIRKGAPNQGGKGRGSGKGGIRDLLKSSLPPITVDWKSIVRRYLVAAQSRVPTWLKPSIRGIAGGYQSPGRSTSPNKLDAIFAIDTSGSVGDKELRMAINFANDIAKTANKMNIRIVLWHSSAYFISKPLSEKGAVNTALNSLKIQAGGTTMSSIDPLLVKNNIKPIVVVYFTDGQVESNPKFGRYEKLFVLINPHSEMTADSPEVKNLKPYGQIVITPTLK